MLALMRKLWDALEAGARTRLKFATLGLLVVAGLDVIGVGLVVPLTQLLTDPDNPSGLVESLSDLLGNPSQSTLALELTAIIFVMFLTKGLFSLWFRWWILGFINLNAADRADDLFRRYLAAPYGFHLRRNSAELLRTLNTAIDQAYISVISSAMIFLSEAVTMLAVTSVLLVLRPGPAVVALVYFTVVGWAFMRFVRRKAVAAGVELQETKRLQLKSSLQALGGIKEVTVRGVQKPFAEEYQDARVRTAKAQQTAGFLNEAPRYVIETIFIMGIAVMAAVIFTGNDPNQATATLALFVAAGFRMMPSISRVMGAVNALRVGTKGVDLVLADFDALEPAPAFGEVSGRVVIDESVRVDDLHFSYPDAEEPALRGVSFTLPAGESLAVVGASGAGKTTLVDLILGLDRPGAGRIFMDGIAIDDDLGEWQRAIGLVPQDVYLLDDTIEANITFGRADEVDDPNRLAEAVARSQLGDLIAELPVGLGTIIGERGVRLSGGQRQRIGIARALYIRPQLLVLDEATSALDNQTERRITDTIDSLHGELTMIVVAHRLSTVRRCDQLIFMADGQIESTGTFAEVRDTNAEFARLVELGSLDGLERHAGTVA